MTPTSTLHLNPEKKPPSEPPLRWHGKQNRGDGKTWQAAEATLPFARHLPKRVTIRVTAWLHVTPPLSMSATPSPEPSENGFNPDEPYTPPPPNHGESPPFRILTKLFERLQTERKYDKRRRALEVWFKVNKGH